MSHVAVLPVIHRPWADRCLATADPHLLLHGVVVDNTETNIGVAASWNRGIERMRERGADWLVVMSAACRFGPKGGRDFLLALHENRGAVAVEAAHGIGWHLIAIAADTFDAVGTFDENFFAYHEDIDFSRRVHCWLGEEPPWWPKVSIDVAIAGFAHGIDLGGAVVDAAAQERYYRAKWHGAKGEERTCLPFGDQPLHFWPRPNR